MTYNQYLIYFDACQAILKFNTELADVITQYVKDNNGTTYPKATLKQLGELVKSDTKYAYQIVDEGETLPKPSLRNLLNLSQEEFVCRIDYLGLYNPNTTSQIKLTEEQFNFLKTGQH